jgi:hypothetical protein
VLDVAPGGEHDHGQRRLGGGHHRQYLEAAATGQHHVQHDEVDVLGEGQISAGDAVQRRQHLESVRAESPSQEIDDSRLILDDQDQSRHGRPPWPHRAA